MNICHINIYRMCDTDTAKMNVSSTLKTLLKEMEQRMERRKAKEESKICIFFALSPKKCQWFKDFPYRKYSYAQFQWNGIVIERQNVSHQIWTRRAAHKTVWNERGIYWQKLHTPETVVQLGILYSQKTDDTKRNTMYSLVGVRRRKWTKPQIENDMSCIDNMFYSNNNEYEQKH